MVVRLEGEGGQGGGGEEEEEGVEAVLGLLRPGGQVAVGLGGRRGGGRRDDGGRGRDHSLRMEVVVGEGGRGSRVEEVVHLLHVGHQVGRAEEPQHLLLLVLGQHLQVVGGVGDRTCHLLRLEEGASGRRRHGGAAGDEGRRVRGEPVAGAPADAQPGEVGGQVGLGHRRRRRGGHPGRVADGGGPAAV